MGAESQAVEMYCCIAASTQQLCCCVHCSACLLAGSSAASPLHTCRTRQCMLRPMLWTCTVAVLHNSSSYAAAHCSACLLAETSAASYLHTCRTRRTRCCLLAQLACLQTLHQHRKTLHKRCRMLHDCLQELTLVYAPLLALGIQLCPSCAPPVWHCLCQTALESACETAHGTEPHQEGRIQAQSRTTKSDATARRNTATCVRTEISASGGLLHHWL
jgi:hypothetical protein